VADRDAALGGGAHVDVVKADGVLADDFELWAGGVHQRGVNRVAEQGEQAVDARSAG